MTKLLKHLPDFLQDVKEFKAEEKAIAPELESLSIKVKKLQDSQYINYADINSLIRYEKMFNLIPQESIDSKRLNILSLYNTKVYYTYYWLKTYLDNLVGEGNYSLFLSNLYLNISLSNRVSLYFDNLKKFLREIIPANVMLEIRLVQDINVNIFYGGVIRSATKIKI